MDYEKLKKILLNYYAEPSVYPILSGKKRPAYEKIYEMSEVHDVPFKAWLNIVTWLDNQKEVKPIPKPIQNKATN